MEPIIARYDDLKDRIFPSISASLYESPEAAAAGLTKEQSAAVKLLRTSDRKLLLWQKYLSRKMDTSGHMARLLKLHRRAFQMERAGQWRRADFFWRQTYAELATAFEKDADWQSLADFLSRENPGLKILADASELQTRFTEELLIDTHAAFYNGHAQSSSGLNVDSRAWAHLEYITKIHRRGGLSPQKKRLIASATEARISLLEKVNRWQEAIELCSSLLEYDPDSLVVQERLADLYFSQMLSNCNAGGSQEGDAWSVDALQNGIASFNRLRQASPLNLRVYEVLSDLHVQWALKLAAAQHLSSALVSAQQAVTFNPNSEGAAKTLGQLTEKMYELQEDAKQFRSEHKESSQLRENSQLRLDWIESRQLDEARLGFAPLEEYKKSAESHKIEEALKVARARTPRRIIILGGSVEEQNKRAQNVPFLEPDSAASKLLGDPFDYWLLSGQNLRLKFQALAAIMLLAVVCGFVIKDTRTRSIREASYQRLIQASNKHDYKRVVEEAETFLSHPVLATADDREEDVIKRYEEALVRWAARQFGVAEGDLTAHFERYRQLTAQRNQETP